MREEVESGLGEVAAAQKRLEEVYAEYANPDADFDALAEEQGRLKRLLRRVHLPAAVQSMN